nr:MAG TPA: hypothetical protein [Caudoviricetes sp.]
MKMNVRECNVKYSIAHDIKFLFMYAKGKNGNRALLNICSSLVVYLFPTFLSSKTAFKMILSLIIENSGRTISSPVFLLTFVLL